MGRRNESNPKTYSLRLSTEARFDLRGVGGYIAYINHQPVNALKVYIAIRKAIYKIAQNPFAFKECEELPTVKKIYRRAHCKSWTIFYKIIKNEVLILAIIHQGSSGTRIKALRRIK